MLDSDASTFLIGNHLTTLYLETSPALRKCNSFEKQESDYTPTVA